MARCQHLPIWVTAMQLALLVQVGNRWRVLEADRPDGPAMTSPPHRRLELTAAHARLCALRWRGEGQPFVLRQAGHQKDGRCLRVVAARWCPPHMAL